MRKVLFFISIFMLSYSAVANAYECICNCNSDCIYGKTCIKEKECKIYKSCEEKTVCFKGKNKTCKKISICHIPPGNPTNAHNICVSESAISTHLNHGDYLGKCNLGCEKREVCIYKKCCKYVEKCKCNEWDPECPQCNCFPDAGVEQDNGVVDANVEQDSGVEDAGVEQDSSVEDAGVEQDSSVEDAGVKQDSSVRNDRGIVKTDSNADPDMEVIDNECEDCPKGTFEENKDFEMIGGGGCSISGKSSGLGIVFIMFLILIFIRRSFIIISILSLFLIGTSQAAPPINNFKTAPSANDYYTTLSSNTLNQWDFNVQLIMNYAHKPLRVVDRATGNELFSVVRFRLNADLAMSLGFTDWLELGVVFPTSAGQSAGDLNSLQVPISRGGFDRADFKDVRVVPKVKFASVDFGNSSYNLAFAVPFTAPTGNRNRLLGENGATITPTLIVGFESDYFNLDLNAGVYVVFDQDFTYMNQNINHSEELVYGVGLNIPLINNYGNLKRLALVGDAWGSFQFEQQNKEEIFAEAMGGLRAGFDNGVVINVGAGGGITKGYGVPEYRIMWGFGWKFDYVKQTCPACKTKIVKKIVERVVEKVVEKPVVINRTLVIPPVYFDTDKSVLRPDAIQTLNKTIGLLRKNPWVEKLRLEGHCDHRASKAYNENLGWKRVYAVMDYLLNSGVKTELEPRSYGETQRVDTSETEDGMSKNRRVEFHVLKVRRK